MADAPARERAPRRVGRTIDLVKLALAMDRAMMPCYRKLKLVQGPSHDGATWFFSSLRGVAGFASCESNSQDLKVPTVTIAISLGSAKGLTKWGLLKALDDNRMLFGAVVSAAELNGEWVLLLLRRVAAADFRPDEFTKHLEYLVSQSEMFLEGMGVDEPEPCAKGTDKPKARGAGQQGER